MGGGNVQKSEEGGVAGKEQFSSKREAGGEGQRRTSKFD